MFKVNITWPPTLPPSLSPYLITFLIALLFTDPEGLWDTLPHPTQDIQVVHTLYVSTRVTSPNWNAFPLCLAKPCLLFFNSIS